MKTLFFLIVLLSGLNGVSQVSNFNGQRNWTKNKKEISFGVGATQFLGDLGGQDQIGRDYSLVDIDLPSTGMNVFFGYRYRWHPYWSMKSNFTVGLIRGSDEHTQDIIRNSRNLHFRSPIFDFQQRIEFILFSKEKFGNRFNIAGTKYTRMHEKSTQLYFFTGLGLTCFNPQASFNGSWINLRPLRTEGQGLQDGPEKYLPVTANIPFGFGMRWAVSEVWRIGFEATYMKTFTDYMDDVSGNYYYNPTVQTSPEAIYLSNPALSNLTWFNHGEKRGDDELDAFFYLNFIVTKNITYKNYNIKFKKFKGPKVKF